MAAAIEIRNDAAGVNASVFKAVDQVGGAVGVAVLATVIRRSGANGAGVVGYQAAFLVTAAVLMVGAAVANREIRRW